MFGKDITERKKMEELLRENQKKYQDLIETNYDFIWEMDSLGRYTYCSPQMEKLWGLKPAEMIGKTPFDMMPPGEKERTSELFKGAVNSPKPFSGLQTTSYDSQGRLIFLKTNGVPFFDDQGRLLGFRGMSRDITERKQGEQALLESEAKFRLYVENSPVAVFVANSEGKYEYVNDAACKLLGYSKEELLEMSIPQVAFKQNNQIDLSRFDEVKQTGKSLSESPLKTKNGLPVYVILNSVKLPDGKLIAFCENITERKKLEKQLQEQERLATIGATAGMVGHDIRNPLQAIFSDTFLLRLCLNNISECKDKEGIAESLDSIEKNVTYINKIVQDLQDYAKPIVPVAQETDFESVISDVLVKKAIPKNIDASFDIQADASRVIADPSLLKRILTNLVNNAVQAMPDGGKLTIRTYRDGCHIVLTVEDSGTGIPEEIKPRLFTPLFTTKSKGQGFGLAVVKRMSEALGGTVSFESEKGKGTKFIVRLPPPKKKR